MLRAMIRHAAVCLIFAVSLDAFHIGMLPSTTTTTHGFIQSPNMLIPNRLMPVSRCVCCFSKKVVSAMVPISKWLMVVCFVEFILYFDCVMHFCRIRKNPRVMEKRKPKRMMLML